MKTLILILGILFVPILAITQNKSSICKDDDTIIFSNSSKYNCSVPDTVVYDFKTGEIAFQKKSNTLRRGDAIRIKIIHFNQFLYQVTINGKDSVYKGMVDTSNLFGSFSSIGNLTSLVSNLVGTATIAGKINKSLSNNQSKEEDAVYSTTIAFYKKDKKNKLKGTIKKTSELQKLFTDNANLIRGYDRSIDSLKNKIDSLTTYGWSQLEKAEREPYPTSHNFDNLNNGEIKESFIRSFSELKRSIGNTLNSIKLNRYQYLDSVVGFVDLLKDKTNLMTDSLIKSFYTKNIALLTAVDTTLSYKKLQTIVERIELIKDTRPYYISEPIFLREDSKIINLQIIPWNKNNSSLLPPQQSISFELPWTPRHIFGVTGGLYMGTLHNNTYSNEFDSTSVTSKGYRLIKENVTKFEFGLNVLAYYDYKLGNNDKCCCYLGGAFGAGTSIEPTLKPRIFIGPNLAFGTKNRLLITAGICCGYVSTLSAAYSTNVLYTTAQSGYSIDVLKLGGFLSISYSFISN